MTSHSQPSGPNETGPNETRLVRAIVIASALCSVVLAWLVSLGQSRSALLPAELLVVGIVLWLAIPYLQRIRGAIGCILALCVLNLLILVPELALRASGFRYESRIEFGYPKPRHFMYFEPHEQLLWKIRPGYEGVNSLGFPGPEIEISKPDAVFRILFLGDSVTQQGYPEMVEHFLNLRFRDGRRRFESTVLAVMGYSSYQGRVLTEIYGRASAAAPDLVVVFFGWNDHWRAYGSVDAEKITTSGAPRWNRFTSLYHNVHLLQAATWIAAAISGGHDEPIESTRVPIEVYGENLTDIAAFFHEADVPVVLVSAPTSHYELGVPPYLVEQKFVRSADQAVAIHREYNQVVRDTAANGASYLLDLEAEFELFPSDDLERLFMSDGIHLTPSGLAVVAERLSEIIADRVLQGRCPAPC